MKLNDYIVTVTYRILAPTEDEAVDKVNEMLQEGDEGTLAAEFNIRWVETTADEEKLDGHDQHPTQ